MTPAFRACGSEGWAGATWVREPGGTLVRTDEDDDGLLVLVLPKTPPTTLREDLACEWRPGDVW